VARFFPILFLAIVFLQAPYAFGTDDKATELRGANAFALSPGGRYVAVVKDGSLEIHRGASGHLLLLASLPLLSESPPRLQYVDQSLLVVGLPQRSLLFTVPDLVDSRSLGSYSAPVEDERVSSDGQVLVRKLGTHIEEWNLGTEIGIADRWSLSPFTPEDSIADTLLADLGPVDPSRTPVAWIGRLEGWRVAGARQVAFSPTLAKVGILHEQGLFIRDRASEQVRRVAGTAPFGRIELISDSLVIATVPQDRNVAIWDLSQHSPLGFVEAGDLNFQPVEIASWNATAFALDGQRSMLAMINGHQVLVWDLKRGSTHALFADPHPLGQRANFGAVTLSTDGQMLATGDDSGVVHVWDLSTNTKIAELPPHSAGIRRLSISGETLASQDETSVLRLHRLDEFDSTQIFLAWGTPTSSSEVRIPYRLDGNAGVSVRISNQLGQVVWRKHLSSREAELILSRPRTLSWACVDSMGVRVPGTDYHVVVKSGDYRGRHTIVNAFGTFTMP
jgi:WD40 repeat protein